MRRAPTLIALALTALGCATAPEGVLRERIGGASRTRPFASPTAYEAYLRAEVAASRGDHAAALRQLDLAELADPSDGFLSVRRVEITASSGDLEGALSLAERVTRDRPELSAAWLALASVRARSGDDAGALTAASRAASLDPDDPDVRAAVSALAGGDERSVADARGGAPDARAGDRVLAARARSLDPAGMFRRSAALRRRAAAHELAARGDWAAVDAMLSPLVELDPTRVADRVRAIEARAFDGRSADAATLVAGLRTGAGEGAVRASERARLWLVASRPDIAAEEARAIVHATPDDLLAIRVLGHALLRSGRLAEGIETLSRVPVETPAVARLTIEREPFVGGFMGGTGDLPGEEAGAPAVGWAVARVEVARALSASGHAALADRLLASSIAALGAPEMRAARDRLRVARAEALSLRGAASDARAALSSVETAWGRHRRGALLARTEAPDAALSDLRTRAGDAYEDALADAWVVLVCAAHDGACEDAQLNEAVARARAGAPVSAMTLRAMASRSSDRREAAELLRVAAARDPASSWTASVPRPLGGR